VRVWSAIVFLTRIEIWELWQLGDTYFLVGLGPRPLTRRQLRHRAIRGQLTLWTRAVYRCREKPEHTDGGNEPCDQPSHQHRGVLGSKSRGNHDLHLEIYAPQIALPHDSGPRDEHIIEDGYI
jgi:hypothetical protein